MDVSSFNKVIIEDSKIKEYLLNTNHTEGNSKAEYFIRNGFEIDKPELLKQFLLEHLQQNH